MSIYEPIPTVSGVRLSYWYRALIAQSEGTGGRSLVETYGCMGPKLYIIRKGIGEWMLGRHQIRPTL